LQGYNFIIKLYAFHDDNTYKSYKIPEIMRSTEYQKNLQEIIENLKEKDFKFHVNESVVGKVCLINNCGKDATHKVGEEILNGDPNPIRHNLTNYVCCRHYKMIFGDLAKMQCKSQKHNLYYKAISEMPEE
jgi:hypothetical protein